MEWRQERATLSRGVVRLTYCFKRGVKWHGEPFDLIALGTTELKQKKAAGVGSNDLYQFKYTRRDSNPQPSVPKTDALSS